MRDKAPIQLEKQRWFGIDRDLSDSSGMAKTMTSDIIRKY